MLGIFHFLVEMTPLSGVEVQEPRVVAESLESIIIRIAILPTTAVAKGAKMLTLSLFLVFEF